MGRKLKPVLSFRPVNLGMRQNRGVMRRVLWLGVLVALLACGSATAASTEAGLAVAKAFHGYPVYWAGEEVDGLPLEGFEAKPGSVLKAGFTSFYGSCELEGTDHPSCQLPLQIQDFSTCRRWAAALGHQKSTFGFRGARAHWFPGIKVEGMKGLQESGPLEIFTGRVTVVVFAESKQLAFAAARALRTVNQAHPTRLAPPAPGSLAGKLACQTKPG
jgi:hypothetical protein